MLAEQRSFLDISDRNIKANSPSLTNKWLNTEIPPLVSIFFHIDFLWNRLVVHFHRFFPAAHCHYWDNAVKKPMEHDRFASGFTTGWTDSLLFFTSRYNLPNGPASELPAAGGQWKVRRREEHLTQRGPGEFVWEWGEWNT